jgi:hypothetical protein
LKKAIDLPRQAGGSSLLIMTFGRSREFGLLEKTHPTALPTNAFDRRALEPAGSNFFRARSTLRDRALVPAS